MKTLTFSSPRGSALVSTMMLSLAFMIIIASTLSFSLTERRLNYREAMRLDARNSAEAVSEYGLAQIRQKMENRSNFSATRFTASGTTDTVSLPPASFWNGSNATSGSQELIIGLITPVTQSSTSSLYYYDPTDPNNTYDPLKGQYAFRFDLQVISKSTIHPPNNLAGSSQTCCITQTLSARAVPLFSQAIFYNMDLELFPGPTMNILGAVHSNGSFFVRKNSSNGASLNFVGPVTIAGGLYAFAKCPVINADGSSDNLTSGSDNVFFSTAAGGLTGLKNSSSLWCDQTWGGGSLTAETATTRATFRSYASQTWTGNLQTSVHGVLVMNPPGISTYVPQTTTNPDNAINDAHKMIEPPQNSADAGYSADAEAQKYSTRSGLYICVNPTPVARNGRKPDGTVITVQAGRYRCFTNSGVEVVLPGQLYWGTNASLNTPNSPSMPNNGGPPVITIRGGGSQATPLVLASLGNEMWDLRRANFNTVTSRSSSIPYQPKQITTIDVDMAALKLMVDKTVNGYTNSTGYTTNPPANGAANNWATYINNPSATTTTIPLTTSHQVYDPSSSLAISSSFWNGAIYIESIDANEQPTNADGSNNIHYRNGGLNNQSIFYAGTSLEGGPSGVRLINGRGHVASDAAGNGLTIATNDAVYVLGHYNADGTIDSSTSGTTNSGRYPETGETPCSICCDAITILSAPVCTFSSNTLAQTSGWNDGMSKMRMSSGNSITNWATTSPSSSNQVDGDGAASGASGTIYRVPYDMGSAVISSTGNNVKLSGSSTEISAAFLAGIVVSNKNGNNQNSGGAHNYPRFLESFNGTVAIRGSIVAMYESRAATEPFNLRVYGPPTRLWGFNQLFASGVFPPLTPRVMSYRRVNFNDIDLVSYNSLKSTWGL